MVRLSLTAAALFGAMAVACAPELGTADEGATVGRTSQAIIGGTESTGEQDFVLQVGLESAGAVTPQCSSSLVARNLLLTARHCVAPLDEKTGTMGASYEPSRLTVYVGKDGPQQIATGQLPAARGQQIITAPGNSMFPDFAFIVLDKELDAPVAALRLDAGPERSQLVNVVGFGMNEENANVFVRMQKQSVKVLALAPEVTKLHTLHTGEFAFGEAACYGDSGGPALDAKTNAIVGVASRVNSGVTASDTNPSAMCLGAEDVYTSLYPFRATVDAAFKAAGAKPKVEAGAVKTASNAGNLDDNHSTATTTAATVTTEESSSGGCSSTRGTTSALGSALLGVGVGLVALRRRRTH